MDFVLLSPFCKEMRKSYHRGVQELPKAVGPECRRDRPSPDNSSLMKSGSRGRVPGESARGGWWALGAAQLAVEIGTSLPPGYPQK